MVIDLLKKIEKALGIICLSTLLIIITLNIIFRYFLYKPIFWAEEATNYLFIWMSFLGAAYALSEDGHIKITMIESRLPQKVRAVLDIIIKLILIVIFATFIIPSIRSLSALNISAALRIPEKYVYSIIPLSFLLFIIHLVINVYERIHALMKKEYLIK